MLEIHNGALPTREIYARWEELAKRHNNGALSVFVGIVRAENNISALSFDIYKPLLEKWLQNWHIKAQECAVSIYMAHSIGDVPCGESSFMCGIISKQRKALFSIYERFIEDFKANAPIWKYDVIDGARIYAKQRSVALQGSGILA